jgi:hypothetical protein
MIWSNCYTKEAGGGLWSGQEILIWRNDWSPCALACVLDPICAHMSARACAAARSRRLSGRKRALSSAGLTDCFDEEEKSFSKRSALLSLSRRPSPFSGGNCLLFIAGMLGAESCSSANGGQTRLTPKRTHVIMGHISDTTEMY